MKSLKSQIVVWILIVSAIISSLLISSCSDNSVRYNLVSATVDNTDFSDRFEYNYLELNKKEQSYKLENKTKSNNIISKQTGTYIENEDGSITIVTNNEVPSVKYLLYKDETIKVVGKTIIIYSKELKCTMIFAN